MAHHTGRRCGKYRGVATVARRKERLTRYVRKGGCADLLTSAKQGSRPGNIVIHFDVARRFCLIESGAWLEFDNFYEYMLSIEKAYGNLGICKIIPPREWAEAKSRDFQTSIPNDFMIATPIAQYITGATGFFKVNLIEQDELTLEQMHELACKESFETKEKQSDAGDEEKERRFWKSLCNNKTGPIAVYGADVPGSMFGDNHKSSWNVNKLHSILRYSRHEIPGVCSSMMYIGSWRAMFAFHTEDYDLYSINYLHSGEKKCWYSIPVKEKARFESLVNGHFSDEHRQCKEYLRHKTTLISPTQLRSGGIEFKTVVQEPGEFVITWPGAYHQGFNQGFNIAEATNFALPSWIQEARKTKRCLCRSHTVTIDVDYIETRYLREEVLRKKNNPSSCSSGSEVVSMDGGSTSTDMMIHGLFGVDEVRALGPSTRGRLRCVCGKSKTVPSDKAVVRCSKCTLGFHASCVDGAISNRPNGVTCHICYAIDNNIDVPSLSKQITQSLAQTTQELIEASRKRKRKTGGSIQKGDVVKANVRNAVVVGQVADIDDEGMCRIHLVGRSKDADEWVTLYGLTNMTTAEAPNEVPSKHSRYSPGVVYSGGSDNNSNSNSSNGLTVTISSEGSRRNPIQLLDVTPDSTISEVELRSGVVAGRSNDTPPPPGTVVAAGAGAASMSPADKDTAAANKSTKEKCQSISIKNGLPMRGINNNSINVPVEKTADEYFARNEKPLIEEVRRLSSEPCEGSYTLSDYVIWLDTYVHPLASLCDKCQSNCNNDTSTNCELNGDLLNALERCVTPCKLVTAQKYFIAILKRYSTYTMSERLSSGLVLLYHKMAKGYLEVRQRRNAESMTNIL